MYRCLSGSGAATAARPLSEPSSPVSSDEAGSLADNEEACSPGSAGATNTDMLDELLPVSGPSPADGDRQETSGEVGDVSMGYGGGGVHGTGTYSGRSRTDVYVG